MPPAFTLGTVSDELKHRRRRPFLISSAVSVAVTVAVFRLPELFVDQLRRNSALTSGQSGWVYRLLAVMAFAQAAYVAVVLLRTDRVERAWKEDPKLHGLSRPEIMTSVVRNAAFMPLLTLVYGLSAFFLTGERAGFWLFVVLAAAQLAWSYRQAGQIAHFLSFQPEYLTGGADTKAPESSEGEGD